MLTVKQFVFILMITSSYALDCAILLNDTSRDISQIIATCLIPTIPVVEKKAENITVPTNTNDDEEPEEPPAYGPRRGLRVRRDGESNTITTGKPVTAYTSGITNNIDPNNPAKCVVHCIMAQYNMIGSKGFPELSKVAASLVQGIANREMRDFVQDSVDECFQQLSENVELDSCKYSARLVTCLADKARFNCSEWPVGELPFPHKF